MNNLDHYVGVRFVILRALLFEISSNPPSSYPRSIANYNYQEAGTRNYQKMLVTPRGAKAAVIFLQVINLLPQF